MIQHTSISTGGHLTVLESVDSTNNYAMAMVREGLAKHGDGYFAKAQVQGKGQRGKTWVTEPGMNIILTLALQPGVLQLDQQFQFSAAIALAVHDLISTYAGDETKIKWPNDIYWRDRKAGGILIESIVGGQETSNENTGPTAATNPWKWAIVGMGININQTAFANGIHNAVSLKQVTGKHWDVIELARELSGHVQARYVQLQEGKNLVPEYNQQLFRKGQVTTFKKDSRVFEGIVKEVNAQGELLLMTVLEERFAFGEITWVI